MHYEVERAGPIRRGEWSVSSRPRTFATLEAARADAGRLGDRETRIMLVERDGSRWVVNADKV